MNNKGASAGEGVDTHFHEVSCSVPHNTVKN